MLYKRTMAPDSSFLLPHRRTMVTSVLDPTGYLVAPGGARHLASMGLIPYEAVPTPTTRVVLPTLSSAPSSAVSKVGIDVTPLFQCRPAVKKQKTGVYYNNCEIFHEMHPVQLRYANRYTSVVPSLPAGNPMQPAPVLAIKLPPSCDSEEDGESCRNTIKSTGTIYPPRAAEEKQQETSSTSINQYTALNDMSRSNTTSRKRTIAETGGVEDEDNNIQVTESKNLLNSRDRENIRTPPLLNDSHAITAEVVASSTKESLSSEQKVFLEAALALSGMGGSNVNRSAEDNSSKSKCVEPNVPADAIAAGKEVATVATASPKCVSAALPPPPFFIPSPPQLDIRATSPKRWMTR